MSHTEQEAEPASSCTAMVGAALAGSTTIEDLDEPERAAFFARLPGQFTRPSPELLAAYATLSDDAATGTPQPPSATNDPPAHSGGRAPEASSGQGQQIPPA